MAAPGLSYGTRDLRCGRLQHADFLVAARRLLSCSMWTLSCGMHVGSSSLTRDWTRAPCIGSTESYPLDHQGSPESYFLNSSTLELFYVYLKRICILKVLGICLLSRFVNCMVQILFFEFFFQLLRSNMFIFPAI